MSELKPCLPECELPWDDDPQSHAPGCPNAEEAKVEKAGVDWNEADNWAADPLPQSTERGDVDWLPDAKANAARAYLALRAEVERLTKIIHELEDPHQSALDAARRSDDCMCRGTITGDAIHGAEECYLRDPRS